MKILVTGSEGNLGRRLSARFAAHADDQIWRSVHRLPSGAKPSLAVEMDVTNAESVQNAIQKVRPDQVLHLAAYVDVQRSYSQPLETYRVNVEETLNLLEAIRKAGNPCRFLFLSTAHVYGPPEDETGLLTEKSRCRPASPYAASKLAAEEAALLYSRAFSIETIVVRLFNLLGPGQPLSSVCSALAHRVCAIAKKKEPGLLRTGNVDSVRDFITVEDALDGILAALYRGKSGEIYNLCTGAGTPIREVLNQLLALSGSEIKVETDPALLRKIDPLRVVGDASKLERETGFRAKRSLKPAIEALYRECFEKV